MFVMDHIPSVVMINKDVATLSQWLQLIMLSIHQWSVYILNKPSPNV